MAAPTTLPQTLDPTTGGDERHMVVIFNNDETEYADVVEVLMRATGCERTEAEIETWEAHTYGQAPVHFACQSDCTQVASVISSIGVRTEVRKEWSD